MAGIAARIAFHLIIIESLGKPALLRTEILCSRFCAAMNMQFGINIFDMPANGRYCDAELRSNLLVGVTFRNELNYLQFTIGELGFGQAVARRFAEGFDDPASNLPRHRRAA